MPLARTGGFTRLLDAIRLAPGPRPVEGRFVRTEPSRLVLPGIEDLAVRAAAGLGTLCELGFPESLGSVRAPWPETVLRVDGQDVAAYVERGDLQASDAPRPHLHPVRTLGGTVVTEVQPDDHVHHFGASVAISDVDGANFWGGSTYVRDEGPTMLANHGRQRRRTLRPIDGGYAETLDWIGPDGTVLAAEERTLTARAVPGAWALDVAFTLTSRTGRPLVLRSSACKGRVGAGYGGFFWRAPKDSPGLDVFTGEASGEEAVHGSVTPWLALASDAWTLVFVQTAGLDPWFVRVAEYPGAGPALAWDTPLTVPENLHRAVTVVVADGRLAPGRARDLAAGTAGDAAGTDSWLVSGLGEGAPGTAIE
ncbi:DUF6807 domain-containing protein [Actinomadura physcomitrii]|uniref:DUF6807 domain-containing protein n=1 Tax=Actinomadura physcomitrii TaxID=2650748 RepID=UPI00136F637B|nr:PmoA family protein [Actinomadura physcomitrii]